MKTKRTARISLVVVMLIFFSVWQTGLLDLWTEGMASIVNNTRDYTDATGHTVDGQYTISIDLANLESNIGKVLYQDGIHNIYVAWVDNTGQMDSGGYRIGFRSTGPYSLDGASLLSGVHHETVNENSFKMNMSAKMTAKYRGNTYISSRFGMSGLNYKDGDDFSFYVFPSEAYEKGEVTLEEAGVVELTVTDLYQNIWSKRQ